MKMLNQFFFGTDEITGEDWFWFYGTMIFAALVTLLCVGINVFGG